MEQVRGVSMNIVEKLVRTSGGGRGARVGRLARAATIAVALAATWQQHASALEPLASAQGKEFYRRIITLPGAALSPEPGAPAQAAPLPVFSIFYVFGEKAIDGKAWLQVGRPVSGPADGWLMGEHTQDWSTMLVMQYAPPGQRRRVLYFAPDAAPDAPPSGLSDLLGVADTTSVVDRLIREADEGKPTSPALVTIEPKVESGVPTFANKPYLMPISSYRAGQFDDGGSVTLVKIASLNSTPPKPPVAAAPALAKSRMGLVFVIDSTISMQPFIEKTQEMIRQVYSTLKAEGLLENVSFGLVSYRNNMDQEPQRSGLEYVTKIFQDVDPSVSADEALARMMTLREAKVSTHSFDEDAVAGLYAAVDEIHWDKLAQDGAPKPAKFVVLITDAGALEGNDPRAKVAQASIFSAAAAAAAKGIVVIPIHIQSAAGVKLGNVTKAAAQYKQLMVTCDPNLPSYRPVDGSSTNAFASQINAVATTIVDAARVYAKNQPLAKKEVGSADPSKVDLGQVLWNELFNAQMRYIGEVKGTEAPRFFNGWAADKDLVRHQMQALRVSVFLTRNQLSELSVSLRRILDQAKKAGVDLTSFFSLLRSLAAATIQDPQRYQAKFERIADSNLLPAYLKLLPYRSDILSLSENTWKSMGPDQMQAVVDRLSAKLHAYQEIYEDTKNWNDLGAGDSGQAVAAVPLIYLP